MNEGQAQRIRQAKFGKKAPAKRPYDKDKPTVKLAPKPAPGTYAKRKEA
jgi:hypothetical protein